MEDGGGVMVGAQRLPRVALVGVMLESNAFSPVATEDDFRNYFYFVGDEIVIESRAPTSKMPREMAAFVTTMDATGPWEPVPLVMTGCQPKGPIDAEFLARVLQDIGQRLAAAADVDAVFVANHGAMISTTDADPDGDIVAMLRAAVGDDVPIVMTLDLHANISPRMVDRVDTIIGYQTNPHVDMIERGREAALTLRRLLAGAAAYLAVERLPLTPASVTLLTANPPYGTVMDYGLRRRRESGGRISNVSIFGGFVFSDSSENGLAIVVTSCTTLEDAQALAREIAAFTWERRREFRRTLTSIDDAMALSAEAAAGTSRPVIFSDAGDNPGGGGLGNTTWLLQAFLDADSQHVYYGSFHDTRLAARAHQAGLGTTFDAVFNEGNESEFSKSVHCQATVLAIRDEPIVGRRGIAAGRTLDIGRACLLGLGPSHSIKVVVISERHQTADPMFFECFGLDVADARTVVVKSRGHFRAGFDEWFDPSRVVEVDTAGLTSPILERFNWRGLPRPVYPLDDDAIWAPNS
ncbi:MAG: M81 family metallopeptidase [Pseudomonadota bacterium]